MVLSLQTEQSVCGVCLGFLDPRVAIPYGLLLFVLFCGGVAIVWTYRWYRNLKKPISNAHEDLAELTTALEKQDGMAPDEIARIRQAIERQREEQG